MIFASDLDRTLIYSEKFTKDTKNIEVVEYKDEVPLSYMTSKAKKMLDRLRKKINFVPVTTRTMEQYKRISLFQDELVPEYAITSNGGNVLIDGVQDLDWQAHIKEKISENGYSLKYVYEMTEELRFKSWVKKTRIADDVFFYLLTNKDKIDFDVIKKWSSKLNEIDWKLIKHGRKIYCIPKCVNKRDALKHVAKKIGGKFIISSGDSRMDLTMESLSDTFIVPSHGELVVMDYVKEGDTIVFSEKEGIRAAESILEVVESSI